MTMTRTQINPPLAGSYIQFALQVRGFFVPTLSLGVCPPNHPLQRGIKTDPPLPPFALLTTFHRPAYHICAPNLPHSRPKYPRFQTILDPFSAHPRIFRDHLPKNPKFSWKSRPEKYGGNYGAKIVGAQVYPLALEGGGWVYC